MGCKVILLFLYLGLASAELTLKGVWKENFGWEVTCSWQTWLNDTLQSVRLFRNEQQFAVFRPERNGRRLSEAVPSRDFLLTTDCLLTSAQGQRGTCTAKMELYQNATEDTYKCEVSGERPQFRIEAKEYTVFVPPSDAVVNQIQPENSESRCILNCSSSGLPAPKLLWTIDGQKIPGDFTNTTWNATTKLWHSWSSLNPQIPDLAAMCTPEVTTKNGQVERGRPSEYVVTNGCSLIGTSNIIAIITLAFTLSR